MTVSQSVSIVYQKPNGAPINLVTMRREDLEKHSGLIVDLLRDKPRTRGLTHRVTLRTGADTAIKHILRSIGKNGGKAKFHIDTQGLDLVQRIWLYDAANLLRIEAEAMARLLPSIIGEINNCIMKITPAVMEAVAVVFGPLKADGELGKVHRYMVDKVAFDAIFFNITAQETAALKATSKRLGDLGQDITRKCEEYITLKGQHQQWKKNRDARCAWQAKEDQKILDMTNGVHVLEPGYHGKVDALRRSLRGLN